MLRISSGVLGLEGPMILVGIKGGPSLSSECWIMVKCVAMSMSDLVGVLGLEE